MLSQLLVVTLLLSAASWSANASKETMESCVVAQEVLYENTELNTAFTRMMEGYNTTCHEEGLCDYSLEDETLESVKNMDESSTINDIAGIKGSGAAHFGGSFYNHESFLTYRTACADAGGDVICIDSGLNLEGEAGAAFMPDGGGIETDIKFTLTSFPVCMTKECENEDLTAILENTAKNAFLKSPQIAEDMTSHTESLVKAATVKQVCALSGLETCEFTVARLECSDKAKGADSSSAPSSFHKATTFLTVTMAAAFCFVM